ncbi:hypothetical protein BH09VER1_BH09VER1_18080 [soil metagenome]
MLALFIGVPGAIFYLREVGVSGNLKDLIGKALSGPAFRTEIGKLTLDPFKGLIAQDVEVTETKDRGKNLAHIERLVVSVNFSDLLARRISPESIDHIELDDTDMSVPLGSSPDSARLNLKDVSAQVLFAPGQVRLSFFEGNVQGIKVALSGMLENPRALHAEKPAESKSAAVPQHTLDDVVKKLSELKYPGAPPELRAVIYGDLFDRATFRATNVTLHSGPVVAPKWRVEGIDAAGTYESGGVTIDKLIVQGRKGSLNLSGQVKDGVVNFDMSSSLPLAPFLTLLPKDSPVVELKLPSAPEIAASGKIILSGTSPEYKVTGSAKVEKLTYKGVTIDSGETDFAARNGQVFLRNLNVRAGGGEVKADVFHAPDDFRLRLTNTISPTVFAPMLGPNERAFLKMMEFKDRPYVQIELAGTSPNFANVKGAGTIRLGRTSMRGSWMERMDAKLEIGNGAVTYRDFNLAMGKGTGTGTFIYDFAGHQVRFENVVCNVMPVDALMWADPKIADALRPYRFNVAPKVLGSGMVHLKDAHKNDLKLSAVAPDGMEYDLLKRTLKFGKAAFDVHILGTKVLVDVKSARLMGGDIGLKTNISIDASDPTFTADVDVRRVDFPALTKLYFDFDTSKGVVSGKYKFGARFGQEENMKGSGNLRVEDGHVFAIPVMGPLSAILNKIIPGSGYQTARLATCTYTIADQKINTKDLAIEGAGFTMIGYGDIFFMKDKMNMSVRINAKGIPGIVLFPVSKLFEYESTGSVSDPTWHPKIIPRFGGSGG